MSTLLDLRLERSDARPQDEVVLLLDTPSTMATTPTATRSASLTVTSLGDRILTREIDLVAGRQRIVLGRFDAGSYAVTVRVDDDVAHTAYDVLEDRATRPRYGFVTDFRPGRSDGEAVAESLRAFHLTHVQFYDWMYRHAELLPPEDVFVDTLGRELSLAVVRDFIEAVHDAGAEALAYAAVYAAGKDYAAAHPEELIHHPDGSPWMLGDFLWNTDLSAGSSWSRHIVEEMGLAVEIVGFDGLHLDQYGDPKLATTATGGVLDLAAAFPAFIDAVRRRLPAATLIFNNVNNFPTRTTVTAAQDATYIEVWSPHDDHADLVDLVRGARALAPSRPVILAAYLEPFANGCGPAELAAAKLALATTWAEGGQYLLFGESAGVLVHPYYPNYATLTEPATRELRAFVDFSVANGDLLFDPDLLEATTHLVGGINGDVTVEGVPVALRPTAGAVWVRAATCGARLVIQLVDYTSQADGRWNVPRQETVPVTGVRLAVRVASETVRVRGGHPGAGPGLRELAATRDGEVVTIEVPSFEAWAMVVIDR
ncbi:glycoside hydrolase family 66 protein [Nostocoides sp. HKS02]|uniref:glycoside hydrolase family 66 protein n=1 Tax=Nostocoides sp. HKS02 TaxID=1813880 RepID=UPI0018A83ADF|nr:glycoside hydrolase family 66 protein [Tetrasphaera sp. HKS02]